MMFRDDFQDWLESKKPCAIVGQRWCLSGPLALFLRERTDLYWYFDTSVCWFGRSPEFPLPVWARQFENASDGSGGELSKIQARTALKILREIAIS